MLKLDILNPNVGNILNRYAYVIQPICYTANLISKLLVHASISCAFSPPPQIFGYCAMTSPNIVFTL